MIFEKEPGSSDLRILWADLGFFGLFFGYLMGWLHNPYALILPIGWWLLSIMEYYGYWAHLWRRQ